MCTFLDDPQKWLVSYKDRSTYLVMEKKGPRCNRCRHFGHIGSKCPDKPHPPCCSLCSGTNHQEPRCPNKVCRQVISYFFAFIEPFLEYYNIF